MCQLIKIIIGSTYFFKNQSFSCVGEGCSNIFANCASHLFLICFNILYWKVEMLSQLACIITAICNFLVWSAVRKPVFYVHCCITKSNKIVKPDETTFILIRLFLCVCCHERRQDSCLLSPNISNLLQFAYKKTFRFAYALIVANIFSPTPFSICGCAGGQV